MDNYRQETDGKGELYPHPWLMPDFWQFLTVSIGLGPLLRSTRRASCASSKTASTACTTTARSGPSSATADRRARVARRDRHGRAREARQPDLRDQLQPAAPRRTGARQRQDHQELGGEFPRLRLERHQDRLGRQAGTRCSRDKSGILMKRMMEIVDGEYQNLSSQGRRLVRESFFNTSEPKALVADWSDDDISSTAAVTIRTRSTPASRPPSITTGQPTVILAKTIKGYGMGKAGEAANIAHQEERWTMISSFDRFKIPVSDERIPSIRSKSRPRRRPEKSSIHAARRPTRNSAATAGPSPSRCSCRCRPAAFDALLKATGEGREISDDDGLRAHPQHAGRDRTSQARRADRPRTSRAPSAWKACSARSASGRSASSTPGTPTS